MNPLSPEAKAARVAKAAATRARNKERKVAWEKARVAADKDNAKRASKIAKLASMTTARGASLTEAESAQKMRDNLMAQPPVTAKDKVEAKHLPPPLSFLVRKGRNV